MGACRSDLSDRGILPFHGLEIAFGLSIGGQLRIEKPNPSEINL